MRLRERWLTLMPMEWQRQLVMRLRRALFETNYSIIRSLISCCTENYQRTSSLFQLLGFGNSEQRCSVCGSCGRSCISSRWSYDSPSRDCGAGRRTQILAYATVQPRKWLDDVQSWLRLNSAAHERRAPKSWTIQFNITEVTATVPLHFTSNSQQQNIKLQSSHCTLSMFTLRQCQDDGVETACVNMVYTSRRCRGIELYYTWTRCLKRGIILCVYASKRCCESETCIHCV